MFGIVIGMKWTGFFVIMLIILLSPSLFFSVTHSANSYVDVNVSEARQMIESNPNLVILDVRTQAEYDDGHLENAVLIPVSELPSTLSELVKENQILVYCRSGVRSATASQILADNGYASVYNMIGGITAWRTAGYPVYVKYSSIQEAINNANETDIIYVSSGTYYENVVVNKTVSIIGENSSTTIVDGGVTGSVVTVTHDNVNIAGFTIRNSGSTIRGTVPDAGIGINNVSNCNVSRNILTHNYVGVFVRPSRNACFAKNVITRNHIGIDINNQSAYNIISGNSLQENNVSIHVYYADFNAFFENNLTNSPIGVVVRYSSNNTFSKNEIRNGLNGITLNGSDFNSISGNTMSNLEYGIQLKAYADQNFISENRMTNCSYAGIDLDEHACDNSLSNNTIANSEVGIDISNGAVNNTISRNRLTANLVSMHFWYANLNTIFENNITNNSVGVVVLYSQSNRFYHNVLLNNTQQVSISKDYTNFWDAHYPSGGNYWSDYEQRYPEAEDVYSGPYQNATGSDKIWDQPYFIDENNQDRYPLMNTYCFLLGDLNKDRTVNILDISIVAVAFGSTPEDPNWNIIADLNSDEIINILDISTVALEFGKKV